MALAVMMKAAAVAVAATAESLYAAPLNLDGEWEFQMDPYRVRRPCHSHPNETVNSLCTISKL